MNTTVLQQILTALDRDNKSTLYDVILQTLQSWNPAHQHHLDSILLYVPDVLDVLSGHSNDALVIGAMRIATATYSGISCLRGLESISMSRARSRALPSDNRDECLTKLFGGSDYMTHSDQTSANHHSNFCQSLQAPPHPSFGFGGPIRYLALCDIQIILIINASHTSHDHLLPPNPVERLKGKGGHVICIAWFGRKFIFGFLILHKN